MPLYEFMCEACHVKQELLLKLSDDLPTTCPKCGGSPFKKLMSQTAFVLKGGGWYSEGYSNTAKPSESKGEVSKDAPKEASKETAKPAETKTESTPAAKPSAT